MQPQKGDILKEMGKRIGDWIDSKYPTRREAAIAMKTSEQNLSGIIAGIRPFGPKMKKNFEAIGGNVVSVITGISVEELANRHYIDTAPLISDEDKLMLRFLKAREIDTVEKVKELYNFRHDIIKMSNGHSKGKDKPKGQ
jgi:hypothetical protein